MPNVAIPACGKAVYFMWATQGIIRAQSSTAYVDTPANSKDCGETPQLSPSESPGFHPFYPLAKIPIIPLLQRQLSTLSTAPTITPTK